MAVVVKPDLSGAKFAIDRRVFGTFVEHMGRCVYEGIYEPDHPLADAAGFRQDVADLVKELGATVVRYPGGNFVSGYKWEDGVGPRDQRPVRLDAAWHSLESNQVGLHEFATWAKSMNMELMQAVNLGTRGIAEAAELLEYCNIDQGTALSDLRAKNGDRDPFDIRLWCLGNEVDGPWQIGHKTAEEYARIAAESARLMRFIDSRVELVAAGSSNMEMETFGQWERTVLEHTAGLIDHISIHAYYELKNGDIGSFLASAVHLDHYVKTVSDIIDEFPTGRRIGISLDEWNVWNQTDWNEVHKPQVMTGGWEHRPRLIEDEYTVTDAIVVGSLLISILRNADRISIANQAQLVNVIAPIRSEPGGTAWRQTIFFPFQIMAGLGHGEVLPVEITSPMYETSQYGQVPVVDGVVTSNGDKVAAFFVNRSLTESQEVTLELGVSVKNLRLRVLSAPQGGGPESTNTATAQPVAPVDAEVLSHTGGQVRLMLPPLSWAALDGQRVGA